MSTSPATRKEVESVLRCTAPRPVPLSFGAAKGEGLMRRLVVSKDPVVMLRAALDEAGSNLGVRLFARDGKLWLERPAIPSPFSS